MPRSKADHYETTYDSLQRKHEDPGENEWHASRVSPIHKGAEADDDHRKEATQAI